ncbi:unnamed protein product [Pieris brassicae]|uniref:Cyclic nucleotide-binding domain-containing protein n=1 Tax=Pieris brassicae TaxID=7116 RepID=A0A9P0XBX4_PIEBR|nr:unnamed protein product [Pieris brassicae]
MFRSVSEPSLGTIGTGTIATTATHASIVNLPKNKVRSWRGQFLWERKLGSITKAVMLLSWNLKWQHSSEKWLTSFLMLFGYVFIRYRFIGSLAWEFVLEKYRWSIFVDQYHQMIRYLKFRGAPEGLIEQSKQYKEQLWQMKEGILTSDYLQTLPFPFQMELIFDINVGLFHDSLLLRDTDEAFMRHMSLLMRHELYLSGQYIWSQGVVKNGMICVKRGVIEMLSDEDDESPMIAFKEGTVLGEISLFYSIPSKVSVKAATYVELQVLRRTDFLRAMTDNPLILQKIRENVELRLNTSKSRQNVRKETVREIAEQKMATVGFYLDVLSVFPVYIFTDTLDPSGDTISNQLAVMFPILQVWHIWDYFRIWERKFNSNAKILCLIKYSLLFVIFSYWSGCLLYLTACPRKLCNENSWLVQLIYWETKVFVTNNAKHENPQVSSFSFGTAVFTGIGMSEIAPGIGDLFLDSMRELFYFLSVNRVSGKIKARVRKFFAVQWYYNSAVTKEEIFKDMSTNIQHEISSIELLDTLLLCPLFQECSRDFLQTVVANTRTIVLPENEIVQHAGDIGRDMYIIQKTTTEKHIRVRCWTNADMKSTPDNENALKA